MKDLFNNVYKNRRVLVTGHTGFKGAWLTLWLVEMGAEVIGYSLDPPTEPNLFSALKLNRKITDIRADVRNGEKLKETVKKYNPEIIFHLAAQALVKESYRSPKMTYETNVMGTVNLFEAVRESNSVRVVINVTTDKCYDNKECFYGYKETDPLGGYDPYSSSKACSEIVTAAYRNSFFNESEYGKKHKTAIATARAGNVIGGGDWAKDRLVPDCIRSLSKKKQIVIRSPNAVRPWQHVLEPLSGYLYLASLMWQKSPKYSEAWNFGPLSEDVLNVESVVKSIINTWGSGSYKTEVFKEHHEAKLLMLDITKSRQGLKWKPAYKAKEAIEKTCEWYRRYYSKKEDMYKFSVSQIKEYVDNIKD